ncbi:MAG: hypothetical protein OEV50_00440 [Candidatus Aminicenantes bacterium]|nr:hypothetical protein [Candidatus Aminicenantes bacterium]
MEERLPEESLANTPLTHLCFVLRRKKKPGNLSLKMRMRKRAFISKRGEMNINLDTFIKKPWGKYSKPRLAKAQKELEK